jgi:hypothetical protein
MLIPHELHALEQRELLWRHSNLGYRARPIDALRDGD